MSKCPYCSKECQGNDVYIHANWCEKYNKQNHVQKKCTCPEPLDVPGIYHTGKCCGRCGGAL